ncbi:hypothetical protein [Secundilactobacillus similis]|uniref:Uncharacterized protein n=1 Tax=Secundilactobacillus similis DSM 23365 = JCM 2765 TaxID=1423804 RepID=A0A0R2F2W2_9LACO|nr:hypothetical protein [Secundilactobacillus similis]KRN20629.1 hypothetical protein FD14_GL001416 [Secundilactobacillus similis DSM 23365 = JCM 2765]
MIKTIKLQSIKKAALISAYTTMIKKLQQRINSTPVSDIQQLEHDFSQMYHTQARLAELTQGGDDQ